MEPRELPSQDETMNRAQPHGKIPDDREPAAGEFPDATLDLPRDAERQLLDFVSGALTPRDAGEPAWRRRIKRVVPHGAVEPLRIALTTLALPVGRRRAQAALERGPVLLHLGSGFSYKDDWVNLDRLPARVDVPWDLARGIPFPDDSVETILHEHLLEHLTMPQGYALALECLRVLKPGGVLRIGVPDAGHVVQSYAGGWDPGWALDSATGMIAIQRLFYEHGHRAMYDGQTLKLLLRTAGFTGVERRGFGEGRQQPNADSEARRAGTLYVEGVKPSA